MWCKGCKNDFSFQMGCRLQNELKIAGLNHLELYQTDKKPITSAFDYLKKFNKLTF